MGSNTETETGAAAQSQPSGNSTNVVIPLYKEEVRVGTRLVPAGTVELHKSVKTETFNQPVQLRQETLTVNRLPAGAASTNAQGSLTPTGRTGEQNLQAAGDQGKTFQDQDIVIQLYREEPVVQKQIVPSGQIVAQKQAQSQQMNIQEQVRREQIQVNKSGDAKNVNVSPNVQNAQPNEDQPTAEGAPPSGQEETSGSESGGNK